MTVVVLVRLVDPIQQKETHLVHKFVYVVLANLVLIVFKKKEKLKT